MSSLRCRSHAVPAIVAVLLCCTWGVDAYAQEDAESSDFEKKSFWFVGTSNYHLRLKESEGEIDTLLNGALALLFPRWDKPTTFKDWSEDWRIWDLWIGYGRDINAKSSWSVYGGGGAGTVSNTERYFPLGIPLKLDVDFARRSILLGSSLSYYPFGKPEKTGRGFKESLKGARPQGELNVTYSHQTRIGDVSAALPLIGSVIHYKDEKKDRLINFSPRLGIEVPVTKDDSINILGGYLFFTRHADEYNGFLLEIFARHRF